MRVSSMLGKAEEYIANASNVQKKEQKNITGNVK